MKRTSLIGLLCLGLLATLALGGCSLFPSSWEVYGTWVNTAYNGMGGGPPAKMVVKENGDADFYDYASDSVPLGTAHIQIVDDWTEKGEHWFKMTMDMGFEFLYSLFVITDGGDTLQGNSSDVTYPTQIDPAGGYYGIFYRQD